MVFGSHVSLGNLIHKGFASCTRLLSFLFLVLWIFLLLSVLDIFNVDSIKVQCRLKKSSMSTEGKFNVDYKKNPTKNSATVTFTLIKITRQFLL